MSTRLVVSSVVSALALALLGGCECGHHGGPAHERTATEPSPEGTAEETPTDEATPAAPAHPTGPLGWTAVVENEDGDGEYVEHRMLLWRTGAASGPRPESLPFLGRFSNWAGSYSLYTVGEETGTEHPLTLVGVRGTCEPTPTRALHLHVTFEPHRGDTEERLYDAIEFEGCDGPFVFGAEGTVGFEELSTRTMEAPPPEVAAVVADREQEITDDVGDEPMRLVGREVPSLGVWVMSGWEAYVVRGTTIVAHTESSLLGVLTVGPRVMLLLRGEQGPELVTPGESSLDRVDPDADPAPADAPAGEAAH